MKTLAILRGAVAFLAAARVSKAFLAGSLSSARHGCAIPRPVSDARCTSVFRVSMNCDDGLTRDEFSRQTMATVLAGITAAANASPAAAKRGLSSPSAAGSRVNKDPISLLQWGLPINCPGVREVQEAVESAKYDIYLKNWGRALSSCQKAKTFLSSKRDDILKSVRGDSKGEAEKLMATIDSNIGVLTDVLNQKEGTGTVGEREKLDAAYPAQVALVNSIGDLEALMVPADYAKKLEANIPSEYSDLPRLLGRAKVEFVLEKPGKGEKFDVEGTLYDQVRLVMELDGYTAPITAGCIMDLVGRGFYSGKTINRSDGFVVQTGDPDPEGEKHDYIPPGASEPRKIPLEIAVKGDPFPMYSLTTEDDSRGYAATKLPFQAYGALGMARSEFEADSASSQFFWLLFDSDLTPAGKNLLDGRYTNFGYTVENSELLADVKEGDVIKSTKILSGMEAFKKSK